MRVPACVSWPGHIEPGSVVEVPLHVVDWYPTLLARAGAEVDQALPLDGYDVWPVITAGAPSTRDTLLLNAEVDRGALRQGRWKLVLDRLGPVTLAGEKIELFDVESDPNEARNVASEHPDVVRALRSRFDAFAAEAAASLAGPKRDDFEVPAVWGQHD